MASVAGGAAHGAAPVHTSAYRTRRFLNWFPLGLTYALLYMGRYNLTVAKNSLGELMTKEDFGLIFGAGTITYALSFLLNGPLVDRIGGRRGMLIGAAGSLVANVAMGGYLAFVLASGHAADAPLLPVFSVLYAVNMYFQSYGAVSIVKVNASWFHVSERGGFSGIFGTMISSGIFLAFTVNDWFLSLGTWLWPDRPSTWIVFFAPAALLAVFLAIEAFLLRDRPSDAGFADFDTGDASSGDASAAPLGTLQVLKRILTNPIILTVAAIEFCTGVLRNGVMQWFPIYAKEVWALPKTHLLMTGSWDRLWLIGVMFCVAAISFFLATRSRGNAKGILYTFGGLAFLAPFVQGGWGGLLFVSGVIGGNVAGWVSDLFFQSRRGPAAAGMYGFLAVLTVAMIPALARPTNVVQWADAKSGLLAGDEVTRIAGRPVRGWEEVGPAVACVQPRCVDSGWDEKACMCKTALAGPPAEAAAPIGIAATVRRGAETLELQLPDPLPKQRAGDKRAIKAQPVLPFSEWSLGVIVFLISVCVIGTHGLLSGTATMDFGGRKGAATAVGVIDGFVYLGTALQSVSLGYLTTRDWAGWPIFLAPFAVIGFLLCLRIWNARPAPRGAH